MEQYTRKKHLKMPIVYCINTDHRTRHPGDLKRHMHMQTKAETLYFLIGITQSKQKAIAH